MMLKFSGNKLLNLCYIINRNKRQDKMIPFFMAKAAAAGARDGNTTLVTETDITLG